MKTGSKITVEHAIDLYFNRNEDKLLDIFGSERSAKNHLKNDIEDLPANYFKTRKHANELFNDYVNTYGKPEEAQLLKAKKEAVNKDIWSSGRALNKRINPYGFVEEHRDMGMIDDEHIEMLGYYDVKNTGYKLAYMRSYNGRTPYEYWEYVENEE